MENENEKWIMEKLTKQRRYNTKGKETTKRNEKYDRIISKLFCSENY